MEQDERLGTALSWVLRSAVTLAFFITLIGYVLFLYEKGFRVQSCGNLKLYPLKLWFESGWGSSMAALGILGFIFVPVSRVLYSAWYYSKKRNLIYAGLSIYVLVMIAVGILIGASF